MKCKNWFIVGKTFFLLLLWSVCVLAGNSKPSFDCSEARTFIEKSICADAELSRLDARLGEAYAAALQDTDAASVLKQQQRQWLKARDACSDSECLFSIYAARLEQLAVEPADANFWVAHDYCMEKKNITSRLICSDPELSEMNQALGREYANALKRVDDPAKFKRQHQEWLQGMYACMGDRPCVWTRYRVYLAALDTFLRAADHPGQQRSGTQSKKSSFVPPTAASPSPGEPSAYTFRLKRDTGWTICRDLLENYRKLQPALTTFGCELSLDPENPLFSQPQWQGLAVEDYLDVIYTIEAYLLHGDLPPFEIWRSQYLADLAEGVALRRAGSIRFVKACFQPRLRKTKVLFEFGGRLQTVLGYTRDRLAGERCRQTLIACPLPVNGSLEDYRAHAQCTEKLRKNSCTRMDGNGEHIVLFEPESRQVGFISFGGADPGIGSHHSAHLFLYRKRPYLALVTVAAVSISKVIIVESAKSCTLPPASGKPACTILFEHRINTEQKGE